MSDRQKESINALMELTRRQADRKGALPEVAL